MKWAGRGTQRYPDYPYRFLTRPGTGGDEDAFLSSSIFRNCRSSAWASRSSSASTSLSAAGAFKGAASIWAEMRSTFCRARYSSTANNFIDIYNHVAWACPPQPAEYQQPRIPQAPALAGADVLELSGPAMAERETLTRTSWAISNVTTVSVMPVIVP